MVEEIEKTILEKAPIVKCKEYEIVRGKLDEAVWIIEIEDKKKIAIDINQYTTLLNLMEKLKKEVFELKLEKAILSEFPIDYDDVKAVVLEEMKNNPDLDLITAVKKVRTEHPNLFYDVNLDKFI